MALIECKYCKARISDRALSCPKCGESQEYEVPLKEISNKKVNSQRNINVTEGPSFFDPKIPERIGFLKAYKNFYYYFLNIKPLRDSREFWFGFLFSQIINLALLIIGLSMQDDTPIQDIIGVLFSVHFFFSSFALLTLSIRRIRGGGKSGFWGIFYLALWGIFCLSFI